MNASIEILLSELVDTTARLSRIAALETGDTTSPATWRTLGALEGSGPVRIGELAAATHVTQPTMTGLVTSLVASGWVQRVADPTDARAGLVAITEAGLDAVEDWRMRAGTAMAPYLAELSDDERDALGTVVDLLRRGTASITDAPRTRRASALPTDPAA